MVVLLCALKLFFIHPVCMNGLRGTGHVKQIPIGEIWLLPQQFFYEQILCQLVDVGFPYIAYLQQNPVDWLTWNFRCGCHAAKVRCGRSRSHHASQSRNLRILQGNPAISWGVLVAVLPTSSSSWQAAENTKTTVVELKLSRITLKCKEVSSFPELEEESTEPFELFGNVWKYHSFQLENSSQHHSPRSSAHPIPIAATTAPRSVRATTIFPAFWTSIPSPSRPPSVSRHGPNFGPFFLGQRMKGF